MMGNRSNTSSLIILLLFPIYCWYVDILMYVEQQKQPGCFVAWTNWLCVRLVWALTSLPSCVCFGCIWADKGPILHVRTERIHLHTWVYWTVTVCESVSLLSVEQTQWTGMHPAVFPASSSLDCPAVTVKVFNPQSAAQNWMKHKLEEIQWRVYVYNAVSVNACLSVWVNPVTDCQPVHVLLHRVTLVDRAEWMG